MVSVIQSDSNQSPSNKNRGEVSKIYFDILVFMHVFVANWYIFRIFAIGIHGTIHLATYPNTLNSTGKR